MGYVGVSDVDAYAKKVVVAGGTLHRPPENIPGVGRFAVAADPHGAGFILFKGSSDEAPAPAAPLTLGHIGWHELHAGNGPEAFDFYSKLFGWTKSEAIPMGDHGVYQLFAAGGSDIGGMMTKMAQSPAPFWLYYFNVDAIDAAGARATKAGGTDHQWPDGSARRHVGRAMPRPARRDVCDGRKQTLSVCRSGKQMLSDLAA